MLTQLAGSVSDQLPHVGYVASPEAFSSLFFLLCPLLFTSSMFIVLLYSLSHPLDWAVWVGRAALWGLKKQVCLLTS